MTRLRRWCSKSNFLLRLVAATALCSVVLGVTGARPASAQPCTSAACAERFPNDAGAINVRDYGARGDGHTDDTAALLKAIAASGADTGHEIWHDKIVFIPAGTYIVSDTILKRYANGAFASGMILVGESPDRTTLRLADHAPGFGSRAAPRAVVLTTSKLIDRSGGRDYAGRGEGNDAYENFVENLTVDVGSGNPGAIGIDYLANNIGAVRDVVVRAPAGSGATGIAMLRKWPGPALLQRVAVQGFDVGIDIATTEYGMTLSQVELTGQHAVGLRNAGNMVSAEGLAIETAAGTALVNETPEGMIMLADGAIKTSGSALALANRGVIVFDKTRLSTTTPSPARSSADGLAEGWLQDNTWHPEVPAWSLPRPPAPIVPAGGTETWIGASGVADDATPQDATAALRVAFAKGGTVYLRHGTFWISAPIEIPPNVHRIVGMNSTLRVLPQSRGGFPRDQGMLRVLRPGPPLMIERLAMDNTNQGDQSGIEVTAPRTVLLRDVTGQGVVIYDRHDDGGPAFLEDIAGGPVKVSGPAAVTARQLDSEGTGVRVRNHGAPMTILGLKTELNCTTVLSEAGARTAVLGGLIYVVRPSGPDQVPAFITQDASLIAHFIEQSVVPGSHYTTFLVDRHGSVARDVAATSMPARGYGRIVPLLWGGEPPKGN